MDIIKLAKAALQAAPELATTLKQVGAISARAGDLVDGALDPNGPVQQTISAVKERRVELNISQGGIGVRVVPKARR